MELNLTAVVEETDNQITVAGTQAPNEQDSHGHGEKFRVDRRKLEQMLRGIVMKQVQTKNTSSYLHKSDLVYICAWQMNRLPFAAR